MKTKMSYREFMNLVLIKRQLGNQLNSIRNEWLNDKDKDGLVRIHSKTFKSMKQIEYAIKSLSNILELIDHDMD